MSYECSLKLGLIVPALAFALIGCGSAAAEASDVATSHVELALTSSAAISFRSNWRVQVDGALEQGTFVTINYDADRLTACRGEQQGRPQWGITGYYRIAGGPVRGFEAGGLRPSGEAPPPPIALDATGDLEIWFENTNRWGCHAYDSDFGKNYHFTVGTSAGGDTTKSAPGWVGNVRYAITRRTCGVAPCDDDFHAVDGEIRYDGWARQRAEVREVVFQVWKDGVTNWDNPNLWRQLDVQVHSRVVGTDTFVTGYVSFDRRVGNDARYAIDLASLDPIPGATTLTDPSQCPTFALTPSADGAYVGTSVEFFVTVNNVEIRPAGGGTYRVRYENYRDLYAPCVH